MARAALTRSQAIAAYKAAMAHFSNNDLDASAKALDALVKNAPSYGEAWHLRGVIDLKRGAFPVAQKHLTRAVALAPKSEIAINNLGTAYLQQGKLEKAGDCYRRAIGLKPDYAAAHNHLGNVLLLEDRLEDALGAYRRATLLKAENPENHNNLGTIYSKLERYEEAETSYRQAIGLKGFYPQAHNNLGNTLAQLGRFDEARNCFITAIAMNNKYGEPYQTLSYNYKFTSEDAIGKMLTSAEAKSETFPPSDRVYLNFALGKFYNDIKQYDDAFKNLNAGCDAKRKTLNFNIEQSEKKTVAIANAFPEGRWSKVQKSGHDSDLPIFIIGMPRSGTTLIEQILASHPTVHGAGELTTFSKIRADKEESWLPDLASPVEQNNLRERGRHYAEHLSALAPDAKHVTDKMPHNFRYAGLIHMMLPNAKIIHCVRNPVDTCLSCYQQHFAEGQAWSYDLSELGRYYVAYHRLMEHWRAVLPPGRILDVTYEQVVDDLESQAHRIIDHCGLDWDEACLSFHKNKRAVRTASQQQVREPIYNKSVGRWQPYEKHLGPLLEALAPILDDF